VVVKVRHELVELFRLAAPPGAGLEQADLMGRFVSEMAYAFGANPRSLLARLRRLAPEEQREYLMRLFGIDEVYRIDELYRTEHGPERVRRLWEVLRNNFLAGLEYRPGLFPGRLTLFKAKQRRGDRAIGWTGLAAGGLSVHVVPGDHASILRPPSVEKLAALLRDEIEESNPVSGNGRGDSL
jgi:thioesterase domain-containing protein